jgi:hypothetical protein
MLSNTTIAMLRLISMSGGEGPRPEVLRDAAFETQFKKSYGLIAVLF